MFLTLVSRLFEMSLIVNRKLYTAAIDNLLCMKNAATQQTMDSYLEKLKDRKISWGCLGPSSQLAQPIKPNSTQIGLNWLCWLAEPKSPQDLFLSLIFLLLFNFLNMKSLFIECPHFSCIINFYSCCVYLALSKPKLVAFQGLLWLLYYR